jgi:hypothetical protein
VHSTHPLPGRLRCAPTDAARSDRLREAAAID